MTTTAPLKHPLDWQAEKKTPQPIYNLAVAVAWHKRLASPGYLPDDPSFVFDGPIVDPRATRPVRCPKRSTTR